jgi:hypothetical protein
MYGQWPSSGGGANLGSVNVLHKVLSLRPTNAVARLGAASVLPLLDPRDLAGEGTLLCVPVCSPAVLPGVLRAARELDAVVGLACASAPMDRYRAERFFGAVREAGEDSHHRRPFFLQAGPIRVGRSERLELVEEQVFRFLDAGFTLISLDLTRLNLEDAARAAEVLGRGPLERELPLEISVPLSSEGFASVDGLRALLQELRIRPASLRLASSSVWSEGAGEPDWVRLRELSDVAAGIPFALEDRQAVPELPAWAEVGVRKYEPAFTFGRMVTQSLGFAEKAALQKRASASGLPEVDLLALFEEAIASLPGSARERIEALSFVEAEVWLQSLGAVGSAHRVVERLAASGSVERVSGV